MSSKYFILIFTALIFLSQVKAQTSSDTSSITWNLDRIDSVGGYPATKLNELPTVIETPSGKATHFNGINEALLVKGNPLGNAKEFTIELVIKPDSSTNPLNLEQRYFHVKSINNDDRRILIELRLKSNQQWSLDTFIKSESSRSALLDSVKFTHPVGQWYHLALVYKNGEMKHYVNGVEELSGKVIYVPIENGQISLGARQDPRNWYKGAIRKIRMTRRALKPTEFDHDSLD